MTLVSEIITDAFRQSNLIALGVTPTSDRQTEALRYLNRIVKSTLGNEVGDELTAFPIGSEDIEKPSGYPWWNTVPDNEWFVPQNTRLMCNLGESLSVYLHPTPDDGCRFAIIDVAQSFGTYPITLYGNGRLIEGSPTLGLNTAGTDIEWFYRADTATWNRYSPLILTDTFPFPTEFDDFFITMLCMRLNPSYGVQMDQQTASSFSRARGQIQARYRQIEPQAVDSALLRLSRMSADRIEYNESYWIYNPSAMFDKGRSW